MAISEVGEQASTQTDSRLDPTGAIVVKPYADMLHLKLLHISKELHGLSHVAEGLQIA